MKKINFFYSKDQIILYSLFPIFKNKKKLMHRGYEVSFYKKEISLPIYPDLKQKDQSKIIGIFKKIFKKTQL